MTREERQREVLALVASKLESGELQHYEGDRCDEVPAGEWFNMSWWDTRAFWYHKDLGCGTAACIGGWCIRLGGTGLFKFIEDDVALDALFYPPLPSNSENGWYYAKITSQQAARAIRNYLDGRDAKWEEILR